MLGFTNNNIKDININGTDSIVIDYSWLCIVGLVGIALFVLGIIFFPLPLGLTLLYIILGSTIAIGGFTIALITTIYSCFG